MSTCGGSSSSIPLGTTSTVQCPAGLSEPFPTTLGVHQGSSPRSCSSFAWTLPWRIFRHLSPGHFYWQTTSFQAEEARCGLKRQVQDWNEQLDVHGLRLDIKKTEYMECGPQTDGTIRVRGQPLNKVTEFNISVHSSGATATPSLMPAPESTQHGSKVTGILCERQDRFSPKTIYSGP